LRCQLRQPSALLEQTMDPQVLEDLMMYVLVGGLIMFMAFIVWDLAKKSKAGRFGSMILFLALGLGVLGFIIKTVVIAGLEGL
jgi:hypothetical protein